MKKKIYDIKTMLHLYVIHEQLKGLERNVFAQCALTDGEMEKMHNACAAVLDGVEKGLATRAELYTAFYLIQPHNLFRSVSKNNSDIRRYAHRYLRMDTRLLSYYRGNLAFLYFNDPKFRVAAALASDAALAVLFGEESEGTEPS
jgi:hypothetical protein